MGCREQEEEAGFHIKVITHTIDVATKTVRTRAVSLDGTVSLSLYYHHAKKFLFRLSIRILHRKEQREKERQRYRERARWRDRERERTTESSIVPLTGLLLLLLLLLLLQLSGQPGARPPASSRLKQQRPWTCGGTQPLTAWTVTWKGPSG